MGLQLVKVIKGSAPCEGPAGAGLVRRGALATERAGDGNESSEVGRGGVMGWGFS